MNETEEIPVPEESSQAHETSSSSAAISRVASIIGIVIAYQLTKTFLPDFFSLELLMAAALLGIGAMLGYWLARARFRHIPSLRFGVALSFGQPLSMMVGLLLAGMWPSHGLMDVGVMTLLTAWLFLRPSPPALYVAVVYQILSTVARIWAMVGPGTFAGQIFWVLSHGLAAWALIAAIRPLKASLQPQARNTSPTVHELPQDPPVETEQLTLEPIPVAAATETERSPFAERPVQASTNVRRQTHLVPKSASPGNWVVIGAGAMLLIAAAIIGGYSLGHKQGYAVGHDSGKSEGEKSGYEKGYQLGKKETEERANQEIANNSEGLQDVAFLAGFDVAMHEVWEKFDAPMKDGRWYIIKVANMSSGPGPVLLAEDGAQRVNAAEADWVRFRLGILSNHKPPGLTISTLVPMPEGRLYELRDDHIWGRNSQ